MKQHLYKFIFSNKPLVRIARHSCFWIFVYVYQVTLYLYNNSNIQPDFWLNLSVRSIKFIRIFPIGIIECYVIVYLLVPYLLLKKKYFLFTIAFLLVTALGLSIVNLLTYKSVELLAIWRGVTSYITRAGPIFYLIFLTIKMLKTWYIKQWERDSLIKENLEAELQLLKAQVHPHFLFNTLNNIYAFIFSAPVEGKMLVKKLEILLHYMIDECNQPLVSLRKEISMLEGYIELEKIRYSKKLDMQVQIETGAEDRLITPLLLIPFVENSFKHGASKILKESWIKLFVQADESVLHFSLVNSKPVSEGTLIKNGIGLSNVKKRLQLLYPASHLLTIDETAETFTVNMQVPLYAFQKKITA